MKLKKFDTSNCTTVRSCSNQVLINKGGVLHLSSTFTKTSGFTNGDKIAISQDEENPEDWYIHKDPAGFELRWADKKKMKNLITNAAGFCKEMRTAMNWPNDRSITLLIAGEPTKLAKTEYWCMLTISARWQGKP